MSGASSRASQAEFLGEEQNKSEQMTGVSVSGKERKALAR